MTTTTQLTHHDVPTSPDTPVLAELLGASKQFGKGATTVQAVSDLDLEVRSGELLALLGPNGAGTSTAIGMLTGLTAPISGMARLFGRDPRDVPARAWGEPHPLTDRERQVLRLAGDGPANGEIAGQLHLSEGTVRNYLSEAMSKLGASHRVAAARQARDRGWL